MDNNWKKDPSLNQETGKLDLSQRIPGIDASGKGGFPPGSTDEHLQNLAAEKGTKGALRSLKNKPNKNVD